MKKNCIIALIVLALSIYFLLSLGRFLDHIIENSSQIFPNYIGRLCYNLRIIMQLVTLTLIGITIFTKLSPGYVVLSMVVYQLLIKFGEYNSIDKRIITLFALAVILLGIYKKSRLTTVIGISGFLIYYAVYMIETDNGSFRTFLYMACDYIILYALAFRNKKLLYGCVILMMCLSIESNIRMHILSKGNNNDLSFIRVAIDYLYLVIYGIQIYGIGLIKNEKKIKKDDSILYEDMFSL